MSELILKKNMISLFFTNKKKERTNDAVVGIVRRFTEETAACSSKASPPIHATLKGTHEHEPSL